MAEAGMAEPKFKAGDPVFIIKFLYKVSGEIAEVHQDADGVYFYDILVDGQVTERNVRESAIRIRKILNPPKYSVGGIVRFKDSQGYEYTGRICVVDPYGTMEQDDEPSYDIYEEGDAKCLYKHIRESWVIECIS